jgi:small subunit ribosomal protein S16
MLKIRLTRIGKKNKPMYRLTVAEQTKDPYGRALEILGSFNPYTKELICEKERIEHWLKMGAQMSPTINNLLVNNKIIEGKKVKSFYPKKKDKPAESPAADKEKTPVEKPQETSKDVEKETGEVEEKGKKEEKSKEEKPAEETKKEEKPSEEAK